MTDSDAFITAYRAELDALRTGRRVIPSRNIRQAREEILRLWAVLDVAKGALSAYEVFEAELILNGDWSGQGVAMNQAQHDKMMECQTLRNSAIAEIEKAKGG
jgi:hypothetical protein